MAQAQNMTVSLDKASMQAIKALTKEIQIQNKIAKRNQREYRLHGTPTALNGDRITDTPKPPEDEPGTEGERTPHRITTPAEDPAKKGDDRSHVDAVTLAVSEARRVNPIHITPDMANRLEKAIFGQGGVHA